LYHDDDDDDEMMNLIVSFIHYFSDSGHDEMMAMIAQLYILTSCGGFLGTLHHNFGQMVWELMSASRYTTLVNAHDMSGGVWFSGWVASGFPHGPLHFNPMGDTHL